MAKYLEYNLNLGRNKTSKFSGLIANLEDSCCLKMVILYHANGNSGKKKIGKNTLLYNVLLFEFQIFSLKLFKRIKTIAKTFKDSEIEKIS